MKSLQCLSVPLVCVCLVHIYRYNYYVAASLCALLWLIIHYYNDDIINKRRCTNKKTKNLNISTTVQASRCSQDGLDDNDGLTSSLTKCRNQTTVSSKQTEASRTSKSVFTSQECEKEEMDDNKDYGESSANVGLSLKLNESLMRPIVAELDSLDAKMSFLQAYVEETKAKNVCSLYDEGLFKLLRRNKTEWDFIKEHVDSIKSKFLCLLNMVDKLQNADEELVNNDCTNEELTAIIFRLDIIKSKLLFFLEEDRYMIRYFDPVPSISCSSLYTSVNDGKADDSVTTFKTDDATAESGALSSIASSCDAIECEDRLRLGEKNQKVVNLEVIDPYGEKGSYTGSVSISTGMPHGFGRLEYEHAGRWYEGDWKHGRWTGHGQVSNGDGDLYEGGLKNDHKHGHGIMRFADGRIFEGEYINGQMVSGRMTYQDGSMYDGSWEDGMRHGFGRFIFVDGSIYEGGFKEGEFYGYGKMTWNDGGWYEGEWKNGEMHGFGREMRTDGSLRHDGKWVRGNPKLEQG